MVEGLRSGRTRHVKAHFAADEDKNVEIVEFNDRPRAQ